MPANQVAQSSPLTLVRERRWLVSDAEVIAALTRHRYFPVDDAVLLRNARLVAFTLGMLAVAAHDGDGSITNVDLSLDIEPLRNRLALVARDVKEALRDLWVAGVFAPESGDRVHFAADVVPPSAIAPYIRWSLVVDRLTQPPRRGTQAALMLFRILLDRLRHPADRVPFAHGDAGAALGLGADQIRRGVHALIETHLWDVERPLGRRYRYGLGQDVLVGVPQQSTIAPSVEANSSAAVADGQTGSQMLPTAQREATDLVVEYGSHRIVVPQSMRNVRLPDAAHAAFEIDPATGTLRVVLKP